MVDGNVIALCINVSLVLTSMMLHELCPDIDVVSVVILMFVLSVEFKE